MLIDESKKYIFIHIPRTGGVSIENALGYRHNTAYHDLNGIDEKKYNNYFKFAFVRNSWDRLVSSYYYNLKIMREEIKAGKMLIGMREKIKVCGSFEDFVLNLIPENLDWMFLAPQVKWTEKVEFVGRFENIESDFAFVCHRLRLNGVKLERRNTTKHQHYRDMYSRKMRDIVERLYLCDIRKYGYEF